jgi:hypothetical protein
VPSSADITGAALANAAERVRDALRALADDVPPIVLIDGRSGSGKSSLAARTAHLWGGPVQVVALDDLYPGWDGLSQGAESARSQILVPIADGRAALWRRWDWARNAPGVEITTRPGVPLIVEGCGALSAKSASLAPIRVWLESPEPSRKARALDRDGDAYAPHWDRWAAQEVRHIADDDPIAHATIVFEIP